MDAILVEEITHKASHRDKVPSQSIDQLATQIDVEHLCHKTHAKIMLRRKSHYMSIVLF